jgi:alpha-L-rhamnosidase
MEQFVALEVSRLKALLCVFAISAISNCAVGQDTASVRIVEQEPTSISKVAPGTFLVDFGRAAFGNISLTLNHSHGATDDPVTVSFGEAMKDGRIDTHPPGTVRYWKVTVVPKGDAPIIVAAPLDRRNTKFPAVLTPAQWGVMTPFRWVEVTGWPGELHAAQIHRRAAFDSTWSDDAATFHSSDPMLDRVWDLCHYTIKATTFAGIFVDGDRERLAYEADAYLTQLSYYAGDSDPRLPRATFDRLMKLPTWPSEWAPQMVFIAYADWMQTGEKKWLAAHYDFLKTKLFNDRIGADGLVTSSPQMIQHGDIVDWPIGERDGYVFTGTNTVVNAFHIRALHRMAQLAEVLGKKDEAQKFSEQEKIAQAAFQAKLFDPVRGLYRDGVGTEHASWHANVFPLAFGLVPSDNAGHVAQWVAGRGMPGSPYAAQYLLEGLFENGQDAAALSLITAPGDRSWKHMVDSGTTMTWEAWDQKYKPNQDWNHAWGAAPANILPKYVLGAQALSPDWDRVLIQPHPGDLTNAKGTLPTPHGELAISWSRTKIFTLHLALPRGTTAKVILPALQGLSEIRIGNKRVKAHRQAEGWALDEDVSGSVEIEER